MTPLGSPRTPSGSRLSCRCVLVLVLGAALIAGPLWAEPVEASDPEELGVLLVVDTSGSMNREDGQGRVRIDGARSSLMTFLRAVPEDARVGVRAYPQGSPRGDDGCSPGRLVYGVERLDVEKASAEIRSLTAEGNTPTSAALRAAADDLRGAGLDGGTIVLVSDGESNCGPPPCDVAADLADDGYQLTVHTIGFQISEGGRDELSCIAEVTGGRHVDVDDAEELSAELEGLASARLELRISAPTEVRSAVGAEDDGTVAITAMVSVADSRAARDVQATLVYDAQRSPGDVQPRRRLGNLNPGEETSVTWSFRPGLELEERTVRYRVVVTAANAGEQERSGTIRLLPDVSLDDAGPILADARRVAILGDSFSSGEGAGAYDRRTTTAANGCHRSPLTYGAALFPEVDLFACSGATTSDLLYRNARNDGEPAQVEQLRAGGVYDAVLMTIGGNDIGFAQIIAACVIRPECHESVERRQFDECRGMTRAECREARSVTLEEVFLENLSALPADLRRSYRAIDDVLNSPEALQQRGEPAPLIVMAYPSLMPINAPARGRCSAPLSPSEMAFAQRVVQALNRTLAAVVDQMRDEGRPVYFVNDVEEAFQPDGTYCDPDPYVNLLNSAAIAYGLSVGSAAQTPVMDLLVPFPDDPALRSMQEMLHPNARGYEAMTAALLRWSVSDQAREPVIRGDVPLSGYWQVRHDLERLIPMPQLSETLTPGGTGLVSLDGFAPDSHLELRLRSNATLLTTARTDADGRADLAFQVPQEVAIGHHELEVTGLDSDGIAVALRTPVQVQRDRPWLIYVLWLATGVALPTAGWLCLTGRRRTARGESLVP